MVNILIHELNSSNRDYSKVFEYRICNFYNTKSQGFYWINRFVVLQCKKHDVYMYLLSV